jgi:glycolate oxidase FAD binding subunit
MALGYTIDGAGPMPAIFCKSQEEVGREISRASEQGLAIYPVGGRTMFEYGLPPTRPGIAIDLQFLQEIIDYPAADMTITVEAGMRMAQLQNTLRAHGQRLPVDVPRATQATVGGTLATNMSGPRRYGWGTLRDYLIGIQVVNDRGQLIKAGGRVVKNVAGYDFCKLYIGSLGTLGIISQATFKVRPLLQEQALMLVSCEVAALSSILDLVHLSAAQPVCCDAINNRASRELQAGGNVRLPSADWLVVIGFEGNHDAVAWQIEKIMTELPVYARRGLDVRAGAVAEPLWQALAEFPLLADVSLTFKASILPSQSALLCRQLQSLAGPIAVQAHAGNGIVIGHAGADGTLEGALALLAQLQQWTVAAEGNVVVLRCPAEWKKQLPIWGASRGDRFLMKNIKDALDPKNIFNPGRFLDAC